VRVASPQKGVGTKEERRRARTMFRMCLRLHSALLFCLENKTREEQCYSVLRCFEKHVEYILRHYQNKML